MAISVESCVVALLGRDDAARQQLRQALETLGAAVALEADPRATSDAGILAVGPTVLIVNLEDSDDDALDHLEAVFDAPSINVVFNDAQVSRHLEGWDLARWARHLAAKVLGHQDTMPPAPRNASRLVVAAVDPAAQAEPEPADIDDLSLEAALGLVVGTHDSEEALPVSRETEGAVADEGGADVIDVVQAEAVSGMSAEEPLEFDLSSIQDALQVVDAPVPERLHSTPEPVSDEHIGMPGEENPEFETMLSFDEPPQPAGDAPAEPVEADGTEESGGENLADFDWDIDTLEVEAVAEEFTTGTTPGQGAGDAPESFSWSSDELLDDIPDEETLLDAEVAALAAQLDARDDDAEPSGVPSDLDFSVLEEESLDAAGIAAQDESSGVPEIAAQVEAPTSTFGDLSLAPLNEDTDVQAAPGGRAPESPVFDFSTLDNLSLEPIDNPPVEESGADPLLAAMGLVEAPSLEQFHREQEAAIPAVEIHRVLVLAASIGGPDALRSFLAELPATLPAVLLIVQHLESGYFERLAQQLQKSSVLPVRVATANAVARPGEVLVIPSSDRVMLEPDGRLVFGSHPQEMRHTPSIDQVLQDVADRFGKRATAIIFSGMSDDGVTGAAYLTAKGGEVWVQDPASCVVSSMVDGVRARGLAEFVGSPRELAARCVAQFKR